MNTKPTAPQNIDAYIAGFPQNVQEILEKIRVTIRAAAPESEETISYKMPTFTLHGHYLVYFGAFKKHIGLYPAPTGVAEFEEDLPRYAAARGTLRFPLDQPIPYDLVTRIVRFRVKENLAKETAKGKRKS